MQINNIILENGFIVFTSKKLNNQINENVMCAVATLTNNINYYGFTFSKEILNNLLYMDINDIYSWWENYKPLFEKMTAADTNMGDFVVYKNFPKEVLDMSKSEYIIKQAFIYLGLDYEYVQNKEEAREELTQDIQYTVLELANDNTLDIIYQNLINKTTKWTIKESENVVFLSDAKKEIIDISTISFKENAATLAKNALSNGIEINVTNATDVFRLALKENTTLRNHKISIRNLKRSERKFFLSLLEKSKNLEEDVAMSQKKWKVFLRLLHPSDYDFKRVTKVYDLLYNKKLKSFDANFKNAVENNIDEAIELVKNRIGLFVRNIHVMYKASDARVFDAFLTVADNATITQLVKLHKYFETINSRKEFIIAPNGNWKKLQIIENKKIKIKEDDLNAFLIGLSKSINKKLDVLYPNGIVLDEKTNGIKLPTNDLDLDYYGRGTSFDIPENIKSLRTASYWKMNGSGSTWFDNSFNFLNAEFEAIGECYWNSTGKPRHTKGSVFSGDPVNKKDLNGSSCQMIDLNIDELIQSGVRYAHWSMLSYNNIAFKDSEGLAATMQLSEDPIKGRLYEPSLASMIFKIKGDNLVKDIAYIDLIERKVFFLDLNLDGNIEKAILNKEKISNLLPKVIEHLHCQASVFDMFKHMSKRIDVNTHKGNEKPLFVLYSDKDVDISEGADAFVMEHVNMSNKYNKVDLLSL